MFIPTEWKVIVIVGLVIGGYVYGIRQADVKLDQYANQVQKLTFDLEKEQNNIKEKIVTEYVNNTITIKEKEYVYLDAIINTVPEQFNLSQGWIYTHDQIVSGLDIDTNLSSNAQPSIVTDKKALEVITENYTICKLNATTLESLQTWVNKTKQQIDEANKKKSFFSKLFSRDK